MQKASASRAFIIAFSIFIGVLIIINLSEFLRIFGIAIGIIFPLLVGLCIAFVLNIPLSLIEKLWDKIDRHSARRSHAVAKRAVSLSLCFIGILGILTALLLIATPYVKASLEALVDLLPQFLDEIEDFWRNISNRLAEYSIALPALELDSEKIMSGLSKYFSSGSSSFIDTSLNIVTSVASGIFDTVLAIVISIYVLAKKERLRAQAKRILRAFLSDKHYELSLRIASLSASTFARFLSGQLAEAAILGMLCLAGMLIFGFPFAPLISLIVGITALIPIFGAFIGIAIGAFLILLNSPIQALWFLIFITVLQQIEGNLIYPRVVGRSVGLPALWVLIAVTVGSSFGIVGMLICVPLVSILYCLVGQLVSARLEEKMKTLQNKQKD